MLTPTLAAEAFTVPTLRAAIVFVVLLIILGVCYGMIEPYVAAPFRTPVRLVIVVLLVVAVLRLFGIL